MKRVTSIFALTAIALCLSIAAFAQSGTTAPSGTTSEAKKATPPATTGSATTSETKSTKSTAKSTAPKTPQIDINSASKEELMKLPGVGDATAEKIIAARPFKSKSELESKKLVSKSTYTKIKAHVIAKQAPAAAK
jgi:DNA uptake protein ComE-like DNA-binding protein